MVPPTIVSEVRFVSHWAQPLLTRLNGNVQRRAATQAAVFCWLYYLGLRNGLEPGDFSPERFGDVEGRAEEIALAASAEDFGRYRRLVLDLDVSDMMIDIRLLSVVALYDQAVANGLLAHNPCGYRGELPAAEALLQVSNARVRLRHPQVGSVERYVRERWSSEATQENERSALISFLRWLARWHDIPLGEENTPQDVIAEVEDAICGITREEVLAYARSLLRKCHRTSAYFRRACFRKMLKFLEAQAAAGTVSAAAVKRIPPMSTYDFSEDVYGEFPPMLAFADAFLDSLGVVDATRRQFELLLTEFSAWLAARRGVCLWRYASAEEVEAVGEAVRSATPGEILAYRDKVLADTVVLDHKKKALRLSVVTRFFAFLLERGEIERNPAKCVPPIRKEDLVRRGDERPGTCLSMKQPRRPDFELFEQFAAFARESGVSEGYPDAVWDFFWWHARDRKIPVVKGVSAEVLERFERSLLSVESADVARYRRRLAKSKTVSSYGLKQRRIRMVLLFYRWLHEQGRIDANPAARISELPPRKRRSKSP